MGHQRRSWTARPGRLATALALILTVAAALPSSPQSLDPASSEALATTLRVLLDPTLRAAAIAGNPQAGAADQQIRSLAGSDALAQEVFALAADVFRDLAQAAGGDATAMAQALDRGRTDPRAFAATLSPPTLERLRQLSIKISDQRR
jgi:hypothetical protein